MLSDLISQPGCSNNHVPSSRRRGARSPQSNSPEFEFSTTTCSSRHARRTLRTFGLP